MAEELRIIVTDEGGSSGPSAPSSPSGGGGAAPGGGGGGGTGTPGGPTVFDAVPAGGAGISAAEINIGETIGSQLVSGDIWGAAKTTLKAGAVAASEVIGVAALGIAAGLGVAAVAAVSFANMVERQSEALAGLSAEVSAAVSQTRIDRFRSQVRRADRIGEDLAAAETTRSEFEQVTTDLWTEVLAILLKIWNKFDPIMDVIVALLEVLVVALEKGQSTMLSFATAALDSITRGMFSLVTNTGIIKSILELFSGDDEDAVDPFTQEFDELIADRLMAPQFFGGP